MPLSKRDKKVDITKVRKKVPKKKELVTKIRQYLDSFNKAYVIRFVNPRNQKIAELRKGLVDAQILIGKNKVIMIALGKTQAKEYRPKLEQLNKYLVGQCALMLTNMTYEEVRQNFDTFRSSEYARPGIPSGQTVTLAAGALEKLSHSMEPYLRQLGLPVKLVRGVVHLEKDYTVCKEGDILTPEQCRILKSFDIQLSEFRVAVVVSWSAEDGVTELEEMDSHLMATSLPLAVKVYCRKLSDGNMYFVPESLDSQHEQSMDGINEEGVDIDKSPSI